jgi:5-methyltetrahydrofolate--homocysteine methyltransferase
MKKAVAYLVPFLEEEKDHAAQSAAKIVLATVKGDVHDIGKNIVGVILQCNNYEVIDLGVMVPATKILETARECDADLIGLSGLITPSLEEMAHVAREMQREGLSIPLLIGGATTSKAHTAVKIAPGYDSPTVWVKDASRAVGIAQKLASKNRVCDFAAKIRTEYESIRATQAGKRSRARLLSLAQARANKTSIDWTKDVPQAPNQPGIVAFDPYPLEEIRRYIDWTPFFHVWELKGRYPAILDEPGTGTEARKLLEDAKSLLNQAIAESWLTARGVVGLFPANGTGDDIEVYRDTNRSETLATLRFLRQQDKKPPGRSNRCLSDFVAPREVGTIDHIGFFAVTAGIGTDQKVAVLKGAHDDYQAIMLKALADRLAEAFAERMHERVRKELWGYAASEDLDNQALIREQYQGIRPAPGYPACPDHTEKDTIWKLLDVPRRVGIWLSETFAMLPSASVSGIYFAHPEAQYFAVGKVNRDQIEDYARRKGIAVDEAERWLAPNLGYDVGLDP